MDVRDWSREAFVYGLASVDLYRILRNFALDDSSSEFKAPLNEIHHSRALADPADRSIVAMNVDTPYSYAWLDLRNGPVELTMPPVPEGRYMAAELFDLYTFIVGYISPRTTGRSGGTYLVVGPDTGTIDSGGAPVFECPTHLCLVLVRTELFDDGDMVNVAALQDGIQVRALGGGTVAPLVPIEAVDVRATPTPRFLDVLAWMLSLMPVLPGDEGVRSRIEALAAAADGEANITDGLADGQAEVIARTRTVRSSGEIFGSREMLQEDPLSRAAGAFLGILGNAAEEYLGVGYHGDADGRPFDGSHRYSIRFAPGGLPPVDAFWSITVYDADQFLYANPIHRYRVSSHDLVDTAMDPDGGLTIRVQNDPPTDVTGIWLPCPPGRFSLTFRTYLPGLAIRSGAWTAPPVVRLT